MASSNYTWGEERVCQCGHRYRTNIPAQQGCPYVKPCELDPNYRAPETREDCNLQ